MQGGNKHPVHTFRRWCLETLGEPAGKAALDTGISCPNRGKGGCIYCRPESFTPSYLDGNDAVPEQLRKGRAVIEKRGMRRYFAYFQQETPTAGSPADLIPVFEVPLADPRCAGLIVSTRPDCLEPALIEGLSAMCRHAGGKSLLVELGLQSASEETLRFLNRNHTFEDVENAAALIKRHPETALGVHLILGLPGEDEAQMAHTIERAVRLGVDYMKLHHLQVIEGTRLAEIYEESPFKVYDESEYLELLALLLPLVPYRIVMHRLWSTTARRDLLLAPHWRLRSPEMYDLLYGMLEERGLAQGCMVDGT